MENRAIIFNELNAISPLLADLPKENVYSVRPTYFSNLPQEILSRINSGEEREYNFSSATPYKVDQQYFDKLPNIILQKIQSSSPHQNEVYEELDEVAPFLNTINKAPVYTVPAGYFENFEAPVIKAKAKVVSFYNRVSRYAVAAVITGLVALGSYVFVENRQDSSPEQVVNVAVKNLKDEEIIDFLKTSSPRSVTSTSYSEKLAPAHEIKQQLKDVSDDELQQYIKENSEPGEIEVDI